MPKGAWAPAGHRQVDSSDAVATTLYGRSSLPVIRARESKSAPVGVVGKVLRILEALDASPTGLQLREISQQTSLNKSTAYRFVAHLESEGYLFRDDAGAYVVGPKLTFGRATPHPIPSLARFRKELARVVQQRLAMDDQETDLGARCVAAPVLDESGKVAAAISVSGPITRMNRDRIQAFALATKKAARTISARLRHSN